MSVSVAQANLLDALKNLRVKWSRVQEVWNDDAARRFDQEVIGPLEPKVITAIRALDQVSELLVRVREDCEDPARQ